MNFDTFGVTSSLYLNIHRLRKGPGKFFKGVPESPGKVLDFFVSKRVGTLFFVANLLTTAVVAEL